MIPFFAELARVTAPGGTVVVAHVSGASTPIWTPPETLRAGSRRSASSGSRSSPPAPARRSWRGSGDGSRIRETAFVARLHRPGRRFSRPSPAGVARRFRPPPHPLGDPGPAPRDAAHVRAHARSGWHAVRAAGGRPGLPAPLQRELTEFYNLDEPWFVEFATYVGNVVTLDFGPSLVNRYRSVDDAVEEGFPVTVELILLAAALGYPGRDRARALRGGAPRLAPRPPGDLRRQRPPRRPGLLRDLRPLPVPRARMGRLPARLGHLDEQGAPGSRPRPCPGGLRRAPDPGRGGRDPSVRLRPDGDVRRAFAGAADRSPRAPQLGGAAPLGHAADARAPRYRRALRGDGLRRPGRLERVSERRAGQGLPDDPRPDGRR